MALICDTSGVYALYDTSLSGNWARGRLDRRGRRTPECGPNSHSG